MYAPAIDRVRNFIVSQSMSTVPMARKTGGPPDPTLPPVPYDESVNKMGFRVFQSKEQFDMIDEQFKKEKDSEGKSMLDIARKYWDDPDFREEQRRTIERMKRNSGRR